MSTPFQNMHDGDMRFIEELSRNNKTESKTTYTALVSGHIYLDDNGELDIELFKVIHDDIKRTGIFDDIEYTVRDNLAVELSADNQDHFFIVIVKSKFTTWYGPEYTEYDTVHEVTEIKELADLGNIIKDKGQET